MVRAAVSLHAEDSDFGQASALVREVFSAEQRERLVQTLTGQYQGLSVDAIKERFFWYWENIDPEIAERVRRAAGV
ncbi:MAG: hypothetical protein LBI99_01385 [Propionibacteriaceae bacterium]|nr:hypothetical protein [Propionibacteriaceae bacterium]